MKDIGKTWSLGGIPLVVEKDSEDYIKPRIAELGPLDATYNYIHFGGTEALKRDLTTVLFTGYKSYPGTSEGLYGLIGSGYHELVSDQGTEGNYWITEAKTDRLQDIHRNTGANYRITMKLIKETPIVKYVLVATKTDGLYITTSLTFDDDSDPTWTLEDGTYGIDNIGYDATAPRDNIIIRSGSDIYLKQNQGAWSKVFDTADAATVSGDGATWYLGDVAYNGWKSGYLYVIGRTDYRLGVFYSDDTGSSWNWVQLYYYAPAPWARELGEIRISPIGGTYSQGDVMWVTWNGAGASEAFVNISTDGGITWGPNRSFGTGGNTPGIMADPNNQDKSFTTAWISGGPHIVRVDSYDPSSYTDISNGNAIGPNIDPTIGECYVDANNSSDIMVVHEGDIWYTSTGGSSWTRSYDTSYNLNKVFGYSWNEVLYGSDLDGIVDLNWHVLWSTPDRGVTKYEKSGADPQGGSNSIPYDCGGVSPKGIIAWEE